MPRIVEALQSNVWTGMEFCTDSRPSLMAAVPVAGSSGGARGGGGGGRIRGNGSASDASVRGDEPAAMSPSMGDEGQEVVSLGSMLAYPCMFRCVGVCRGGVGKCNAENALMTKVSHLFHLCHPRSLLA